MVPPPAVADRAAQAWATGLTNLAMLPAVVKSFSVGLHHEGVVGFMAMATSSAYHVCQSMGWKLFGFNEGRWHHIDNVFAIAALSNVSLVFAQLPRRSAARELLHAVSLSATIVAQLLSPWQLVYTVVPIAAALITTLALVLVRWPLLRYDRASGCLALACFAAAATCFVKGLEDGKDWLRLWHSGWHVAVGAFSFFAIKAAALETRGGSERVDPLKEA